jgi:CubicO group peptidase (beta-lactamase class C family)
MIRKALLQVAVCASLIGAGGGTQAQTTGEGASEMSQPSGVSLDETILKFLTDNKFPGATVAVTKRGRLVWSKGYGLANVAAGTHMQPSHRTRVASISKVLTAIGMMRLVETGVVDLGRSIYGDPGPFVSANDPWPGPKASSGLLQNSSEYWLKILEGVRNLNDASLLIEEMNKTIDGAKEIRLRHLLSHTSGLLRSGDIAGAARYFRMSDDDINYAHVHQYALTGASGRPFESAPGAQWKYSNHGFGLSGYLIEELAGPGVGYRKFIEQQVLHPLGLIKVVPNNESFGELDALPYALDRTGKPYALDRGKPSRLGLPTGGWSATARDLARVMCALDRTYNSVRLLAPATVKTMESDAVAGQPGRPIGWDSRAGGRLSKEGSIPGGTALIHKYLPGAIADDEINVAIALNRQGPYPYDLLQTIAEAAAQARIPEEYDLFEPEHRCYEPAPKRFQVSSATLSAFHPAGSGNRLPAKIGGRCPVSVTLAASFQQLGNGPIDYRFRFLGENKTSATFSAKADAGGRPTRVTHAIQLPPPPTKAVQKAGGTRGAVRLEVLKPSAGTVSNPVHYQIECEPEVATTTPVSPRLVCRGGKVGPAAGSSCECPPDQFARETAPNRFACEAKTLCEGGKVVTRGKPAMFSCECVQGQTSQRIGSLIPEQDRYRCVRVATLPPGAAKLACAGGSVKANQCVCPADKVQREGTCAAAK